MNLKQRNKILLDNMGLIIGLSNSYYARLLCTNPMYEQQDIINELTLAMSEALPRYNHRKGSIRTFCRQRLVGHLLDLIRAVNHVHIPRSLWEKQKKQGYDNYNQFYRPFSMNRLIHKRFRHPYYNYNRKFENEEYKFTKFTFEDILPSNGSSQEQMLLIKEFAIVCVQAFNKLGSSRTKALIIAHAFQGNTLTSLASHFGIIDSRLSQIATKARTVMIRHVKTVYPNIISLEDVVNSNIPKTDNKQLTYSLNGNIGIFELVKFVNFLMKGKE